MSVRQVRRRCEAMLGALRLRPTSDIQSLCAQIAEQRGRPLRLVPMAFPVGCPSGLLCSDDEGDWIFHEMRTSALHQAQIIGHELGHLLWGHVEGETFDPDASRTLLPTLDPEVVARVLARHHYSQTAELEAETAGTLLLRRLIERPGPAAGTAAERLAPALEHTWGGRV
ncbi:hypothetical protein [Allostreptomyces psammosilenae]|uniref:IrrE N-terminal-like domain-containing protein n=1 Tax=Allostreptomyces psammosilenae TaxID=1892865 RepID=A0A852ZWW7_9ACTN|nr:hypothetical protein [Allostreptomyces psammosilenae]NYI06856.1 hypothetical protein [Allostreptomyces psammosilenae]